MSRGILMNKSDRDLAKHGFQDIRELKFNSLVSQLEECAKLGSSCQRGSCLVFEECRAWWDGKPTDNIKTDEDLRKLEEKFQEMKGMGDKC